MAESWKKGGLMPDKYIITKQTGEQSDPDADYFVLRLDTDPHARKAMEAYASSVREENPEFANQILSELVHTQAKFDKNREQRLPQTQD